MKILIVDDKKDNRIFLEALLKGNGYKTIFATNGSEALEKLRSEPVDMIISDILMPVMDGFQLCLLCKKDELFDKIPFVFYTATYVDAKDESFAYEVGADRFIRKPMEPDVFIKIIREVIKDAEEGKIKPSKIVELEEEETYKKYSQRLIQKLEDKMKELEKELISCKKAEEKIRMLSIALEQSPSIVMITDINGYIEYVNPKFSKITGFSSQDVLSAKATHLGEQNTTDEKLMFETLNSGHEWKGEFFNRKKNGELYWEAASISPIFAEDKSITHFIKVSEDITEKKRFENTLRESEEKYRDLYENAPNAYFSVSVDDGSILKCNKAATLLVGYKKEILYGMKIFKLYADTKDGLPRAKEAFDRFKNGDSIRDFELQMRRIDDRIIWISLSVEPVKDQSGKIIESRSTVIDISDRKADELRIRRATRALRVLSKCNEDLGRIMDEQSLLDEVCSNITNIGGYRLAWIGFKEEDKNKTVKPVAQSGHTDGYLETLKITWADNVDRGRGPTGTAIRTGETVICKDIISNSSYFPWRNDAIKRGYRSSIALPIEVVGNVIGTLNIYSGESNAFDYDEVKLLGQLTSNLAYGIISLRTKLEKKHTQETLKESEKRYRNIIESSQVGIAVYSEGKIVFCNTSGAKMFGAASPEELIGKPVNELVLPENRDAAEKRIRQMLSGEKGLYPVEEKCVRVDGKTITIESMATPLTYSGQPSVQVIAIDITEKKELETALKETETRLNLAVTASNIGLWNWDLKTNKVDYSSEWKRQIGYKEDEITNDFSEWQKRVHPDDLDESLKTVNSFIKNPWPNYELDFRFRHKDGSYRWILTRAALMRDKTGKPVRMMGCHIDLTERKQIEEYLKESEERFKSLFEFAPDAYYLIDSDGKYIDANKKAEEITGYSKSELIGKSIINSDYITENELPKIKILLGKNINKMGTIPEEYHFKRKDGRTVPVEVSSIPLRVGDHDIILGIARDISERKNLENKLRQAHKMEAIGLLAGGIAHDFNNILSAIIGYTQLAIDQLPEDNPAHEDLKEVYRGGERAKNLVKQILAFSRQQEVEIAPIRIAPILKETLKLLKSSLPATIEIRQKIEPETGNVMADPTQIHQIILNLCTNASHSMMKKGGILEVSLIEISLDEDFARQHPGLQPGEFVRLSVSDTGHGISTEILHKIFEPYFSTKKKGEGTGLGLSVCHGILQTYGGTITVYSEPEQGSIFHVYLPVIQEEAKPKPYKPKPVIGGNERILFIDDELSIANAVKRMLEQLGYRVNTITNPLEALDLFRSDPDQFNIIITNMTMPNITGEKLAEELMKIRPDIPVILCTGFSEKISIERAKSLGIKAFIMKPLMRDELALAVRNALEYKISKEQKNKI